MIVTVCCLLYVPDTSYKSSWSAHTPTPSQGKHSSYKITLNIGKPPPQADVKYKNPQNPPQTNVDRLYMFPLPEVKRANPVPAYGLATPPTLNQLGISFRSFRSKSLKLKRSSIYN